MTTASWLRVYEHSLASVSEGMCPEHLTGLELDGWCATCRTWWSVDKATMEVVQSFPVRGTNPPQSGPFRAARLRERGVGR